MKALFPVLVSICLATSASAADWSRDCGDARCLIATRLVDPDADRIFATVVISLNHDRTDPVLVILTPLGVAMRAQARLVIDDAATLETDFEVCFPDGCQSQRPLTDADLERLASATRISVQYFGFGRDAPSSADLGLDGLADALSASQAP